jgi:chromosome segregation protein
VQDLLSDSSIGKHKHIIISQGNLENILNASALERKIFIEEAAGISKHKIKKERSINKINSLNDKLERINDIKYEIKKQMKPLEKQAGIANKSATVLNELKKKKLELINYKYNKLLKQKNEFELQKKACIKKIDKIKKNLLSFEKDKDKVSTNHQLLLENQKNVLDNWLKLSKQEMELKNNISLINQKIELLINVAPKIQNTQHNKKEIENIRANKITQEKIKKELENELNKKVLMRDKIENELNDILERQKKLYENSTSMLEGVIKNIKDKNIVLAPELKDGIYADVKNLLQDRATFEQGIRILFNSQKIAISDIKNIEKLKELIKNPNKQKSAPLEKKLIEIQNSFNKKNKEISAISEKLNIAEQKLNIIKIDLENKINLLKNIEKQNEKIETSEQNQVQIKKNAKLELAQKKSELDKLLKKIEQNANDKAKQENKLKESLKQVEEINNLINYSQSDLREQEQKLLIFDPQISFLDSQISEISETTINEYKTPINTLENDYKISDNFDENEQKQDIKALNTKLENLGSINPFAAEEFKELSKRNNHLQEQINDIKHARKDLLKVINDIDINSNIIYNDSLNLIKKAFSDLVQKLFIGGTGYISENSDSDGIDIFIEPRGKKVRHMSLLSGGEKALVSVCFLFALFIAKPSPFYILDEIEAALDDINLNNLIEVIRGLSKSSQIVIITHQKKTMEIADYLYGISMNQSGVSKVISYKKEK